METLTHRDRRGRVWRFGIDCTRPQYETIRGALAEQFPVTETDETKNEYFVL